MKSRRPPGLRPLSKGMVVMRLFKVSLVLVCLALVAVPTFAATLNEIRIDQGGSDYDEYFELAGNPGESLDGLTYVVIGDGTTGSGTIECVVPLDGLSIGAVGFFLYVESSYTTTCGDTPDYMDAGTPLNFENSDNVTHMLVSGFTGANADDLDIDDDWTLDVTPWSAIVDWVSLVESVGTGDAYYSPNLVGPDGIYVPGLSLVCDGTWVFGDFGLCVNDSPGMDNATACAVPSVETNFGSVKSLFR